MSLTVLPTNQTTEAKEYFKWLYDPVIKFFAQTVFLFANK